MFVWLHVIQQCYIAACEWDVPGWASCTPYRPTQVHRCPLVTQTVFKSTLNVDACITRHTLVHTMPTQHDRIVIEKKYFNKVFWFCKPPSKNTTGCRTFITKQMYLSHWWRVIGLCVQPHANVIFKKSKHEDSKHQQRPKVTNTFFPQGCMITHLKLILTQWAKCSGHKPPVKLFIWISSLCSI